MVTLRQLRYFDALALHKHFSKAANAVSVSQPALSMQIRDLEVTLGISLIERTSKGIKLTSAGEEVARRAKLILASVRDLSDYAHYCNELLSGPLRLGVIPTIAPYILPDALPLLNERHPHLQLHLRETQTQILLDELIRGDLDLLLLALPVEHTEIETMKLFDDRFYLAIHSGADCIKAALPADKIVAQERLLLLEEGHCLRDQALNYCSLANSDTLDSFGATSLTTVMQMVANGYGVTLLPEMCAKVEARNDRITLMPFSKPEPSRTIGLAWRRTSPGSDDFKALGEIIKETAGIAGEPMQV